MSLIPKKENFNAQTPMFEPYQIVCLDCLTSRLYAEVVQFVEHRQMCWVRPLVLLEGMNQREHESGSNTLTQCYDLRDDSDLLLPQVLFRRTLDVEVMPLLTLLYAPNGNDTTHHPELSAHQKFQQFIHQVWQVYPDVFAP